MTLFSIENLAQSDCKAKRFSPDLVCHSDLGLYPRQEEQVEARPSSTESSIGAVSPSEGSISGASSASNSPSSTKKPPHSYIALIAMAIIESPEKRLLLCDIYEYIMKRFPFFKDNERSWRNSIRHNLSLNECFIKAGRSGDGRGHFWAIHPANIEDFARGDYRRRQARRRVRASSFSPYAYPAAIPAPFNTGFVPMTCAHLTDVIQNSQLAMLPGAHPLSINTTPYSPAGAAMLTPTPVPIPVNHPYLPAPAAFRPDLLGRLPVTVPSAVYSRPLTSIHPVTTSTSRLNEAAAAYHIAHRVSPTHLYTAYSKSPLPPTTLPTSTAWPAMGACPPCV